jgi:hypothetical protein
VGISLPQIAHIYAKISQEWTLHLKPEQQCLVPTTAATGSLLKQDESQVRPNTVLGELLYHHHVSTPYQ